MICSALYASNYCKLTSLSLTSTGIGMETIKILGKYLASPNASDLTYLHLSGNPMIGDHEVEVLCASLENATLPILYMQSCNIGNRGVMALINLLSNYKSSLLLAYIVWNPVTSLLKRKFIGTKENKNLFIKICKLIDSDCVDIAYNKDDPVLSLLLDWKVQRIQYLSSLITIPPAMSDTMVNDKLRRTIESLRNSYSDIVRTSYFNVSVDVFKWRLSYLFCIINSI